MPSFLCNQYYAMRLLCFVLYCVGVVQGDIVDAVLKLVTKLRAGKVAVHPPNNPDSKTQHHATFKRVHNNTLEPFLTIKFGTETSPVKEGQYKDFGRLYEEHPAVGISWGWNCDLASRGDSRVRKSGSDQFLKSFIIPDRHSTCKAIECTWSISIPPGEYTIKISSTDPDLGDSGMIDNGKGCYVQGIRVGDLPVQNSCSEGPDTTCRFLPSVAVTQGEVLKVSGSYAKSCHALNYISFYEASNMTTSALSTYKPPEMMPVSKKFVKEEGDLNNFLTSIADRDRNVVATSVNVGYIDFAMNWLCSIRTMQIDNYFFIATDDESYKYFKTRDQPVYRVTTGSGTKNAADYGTVEYQDLILHRTLLVDKVLKLGFNVLLCDIDAVWLRNPLDYLSKSYDIQAQAENDGRLCGGFMYLRSTKGVVKLWEDIANRHQKIVSRAKQMKHLRSIDESEQELLMKLLPTSGLKIKALDSNLFPHGLKYFGSQMTFKSQMSKSKREKVAVVHNNYVIGKDKKMKRFKHFGLWHVSGKSSDFKCLA